MNTKATIATTLYLVLFTAGGTLKAAQTPPPPVFTIGNTSQNPVPVVQQGPVSIAGGVTLNGIPNVNVVNVPSVAIANTTASPVPVKAVDSSTAQAVVSTKAMTAALNVNLGASLYKVPPGKRLVVEHISARLFVGTGVKVIYGDLFNEFGQSPIEGRLFLLPNFTGQETAQTDVYVISQSIKFYVDAEDTLVAVFIQAPSAHPASTGFVTITGYLVDMP